jgi:phospholipase C
MTRNGVSPKLHPNRLLASITACAAVASFVFAALPAGAADADSALGIQTETPIKHVIVIVGENRTFDHVFGTYQPPAGQFVHNLLSEGIVNADGSPGPNFAKAAQYQAQLAAPQKYSIAPDSKTPYGVLPAPNTGSTPTAASDTSAPPFATLAAATAAEGNALESQDIGQLLTGASGLPKDVVDTRLGANVYNLPSGPFPITPKVSYDAYMNSPVHRFYQNWQQSDCSLAHASAQNPSGCLSDLYAWVETTIGTGSNGNPQPANFTNETTNEGATALGFYRSNNGDVPYFTKLAGQYAMSDNYHQPVMGGTGANSIMVGAADAYYYTDGQGNATVPPTNQIENPDPQPKTNNYYTQDGYSGGSYSNCSDTSQPGVGAVRSYLDSLPYKPKANCEAGHYYLLNNYNPGYNGDGTVNTSSQFTIPPSPVRTIGDTLLEHNIPWKYYGEGWASFVKDPSKSVYCNICNPFLYESSIMTNPTVRSQHLQDLPDLYNDISAGTLPAVSIVKPGGFLDGHPTSSKFGLYEAFVRKLIDSVQQNPQLWASTAIFITTDEGGGYYDSGYIQPVDFFGDGPRIPLIAVSPYSIGGRIAHGYADHASLVKFIERNWNLPKITSRSRDNLPNPLQKRDNPYVPVNAPAIGDLFDLFHFDQGHQGPGNGSNAESGHGQAGDHVANNASGGMGFSPF